MAYDLGDIVPLGIEVRDADGDLANATSATCTVTLPDGSISTASVTSPTTGSYVADYTPATVGQYLVRWLTTGANAGAFTDTFTVRDAASIGVISLADARAYLNIPSGVTVDDEEIRSFLEAAQSLCEYEVGGPLVRTAYTEVHDGGASVLLLDKGPVISVASVTVAGVLVPPTAYVVDAGPARIRSLAGAFGSTAGSVTVVYSAGYGTPPAVARQAVQEALRHLWTTQRGSMPSLPRGLEGDSYVPGSANSLTWRVKELLAPLARPKGA